MPSVFYVLHYIMSDGDQQQQYSYKSYKVSLIFLRAWVIIFLALSTLSVAFAPRNIPYWLLGLMIYGGLLRKNKWAWVGSFWFSLIGFFYTALISLQSGLSLRLGYVAAAGVFVFLLWINRQNFLD